jgi:hypothetical protein
MLVKFQVIEIKQVSQDLPLKRRKKGGLENNG